jgi:hypothetical protein
MKRLLSVVLALAMSVAVASQTTKYGVTVLAEKNVDFATKRTYAWRKAQPSPDKAVDAQIVAAIDRELAALGMSRPESGPADVLVSYASLTRTDVNLKGKEDAKGALPEYRVGTLVIAMYDPPSNRRLLRLRADLPIDVPRSELGGAIDKAVAMMFAEYPTRKKK